MSKILHIIGGGLAGCDAAWWAANQGAKIVLHEMRPIVKTPAHESENLGELVCSNSLRSDDMHGNAVGVLHAEMRMMGSLIMEAADKNRLPAGSALAVDREGFSTYITEKITNHPNIQVMREEVTNPEQFLPHKTIIATGPLTSDKLNNWIANNSDTDQLAFFDAIAPIVHLETVDMDKAWFQSRYDKSFSEENDGKDYLNCPMNKQQYENFIDALLAADTVDFKEWEKNTPYFEGCLPIEVMAMRGRETLRFGPLKPVGLTNPHEDKKTLHAVVQLRQDNSYGTLWNMVGFQTKMKYQAQLDVFRQIPGLEGAKFARLGRIHRNSYIKSPELLANNLSFKSHPHLYFAGQITGVEGYVESAASGLLAGFFACMDDDEGVRVNITPPPKTTAMGALLNHITIGANTDTFQPMNINFGLFPPISDDPKMLKQYRGRARKEFLSKRALEDFKNWRDSLPSINNS